MVQAQAYLAPNDTPSAPTGGGINGLTRHRLQDIKFLMFWIDTYVHINIYMYVCVYTYGCVCYVYIPGPNLPDPQLFFKQMKKRLRRKFYLPKNSR